jgi:hypothetical protein
MANLPFDLEGARRAGASDAEINNFLGQKLGFDVTGARQAGASDDVILDTLMKGPPSAKAAPTAAPESFSTLRGIADVPLQVGKGAVSGVRMIADAFGAGSSTSNTLKGAEDYLANLMSAQSKQDSKEIARIMKEAEDKGALDQVKAAVQAISTAPIDFISNALGTAAPAIIASLGATVLGPAAVIGTGLTVGSTMGAGVVKGSIYDAVKSELSKTGMPSDQVEARAQLAQEYRGKNLDMILAGMAIGSIGATTGAEPAIARQLAKGILTKSAVKQELKNVAEEGVKKAAERGVVKQAAISGGTEFGTEFAQAGQEQLAQNIAAQREGIDVPTMRGVVGQATLEGLAGLGLGSVAGGREALTAQGKIDVEELRKAADKEKTLQQENKEQQLQTAAAEEADYRLKSVLDETGNAAQFTADELAAKKEKTFDMLSNEEKTAKVAKLEESIATRQAKLDAGTHGNPKAAAITQAKERKELEALKATLGGKDVIQPIDAGTSGDGTGIPGGSATTGTTAGATDTGLGRPGVDSDQGLEPTPQDGESAQQPALDINQLDEIELARLQELADAREAGYNIDAELVNLGNQVQERLATTTEVIDQQALADQEARAAAAAEATRLAEEQRLAAEAQAKEAAAVVEEDTSEVTPPIVEEFTGDLDEEIAALNEEAAAELAGKVTPPKKVKPPKELKAAATTGKKTKAVKAAPVTADYLNSETFYGGASPTAIVNERKANKDNKLDTDPVNVGIMNAGHEIAFDAFDTVDVRGGVNPELKAIAEEKNKAQQVKRQQMRKELSGKVDPETGKKYSNKRLTALVSNIPLYKAGAPLEFLTKKELAAIYRKYVGKRKFVKEEKTTREAQKQNRDKFVEELNELQKIKLQLVEQRAFTEEVAASTLRKTQTTGADSRKDRVSKTSEELSKELKAIEQKDTETREAAAQQVAQQEVSEEKQLTQELKEFNKAAEKVLPKKQTPKEKTAPAKSKLVTKIEQNIVKDDVEAVLDVVKDRTINDRQTGPIALQFSNILTNFQIETKIKFGELGANEDGQFDPKTNTITIKGTDKDGYTGARPLAETVMHEVSHATLDHVFDNEAAFIKSLEDQAAKDSARRTELDKEIKALEAKIKKLKADKKNEAEVAAAVAQRRELLKEFNKPAPVVRDVRAALNRLKQNHKVALAKFGKKYNIETLKEFAAEFWSNSQFQVDLALMSSPTPYTAKENFFTTIVKSIASALGIGNPREGVAFKEIAEDLAQLISLPTADIRGTEVSYAKTAPPITEKELRQEETIDVKNTKYDLRADQQPKTIKYFKDMFFTAKGLRDIVRALQNKRYEAKYRQDQITLAGLIEYTGPRINNFYTQLTLASGMAKNYFNSMIQGPYEILSKGLFDFRKATGYDLKESLNYIHQMLEALHTEERNMVKFILKVPLDNKNKTLRNNTITAADRRKEITDLLKQKTLSQDQVKKLRYELDSMIFMRDANGDIAIDPATGKRVINTKYVDPLADLSAKQIQNVTPEALANSIDPDAVIYNATGLSAKAARAKIKEYENSPHKEILDNIIDATKEIHIATTELNKVGNYWSDKVSNFVEFYGFENYVPLKGVDKTSKVDEGFNFDNMGGGKEMQDVPQSMDGRSSVSFNPILQSMSDAVRAAGRAGRKDLGLAVKNAAKANKLNPNGQGLIEAEVIKTLTFEERTPDAIKALPTEYTIFNMNPDGSMDVIQIMDPRLLNSIRSTYKDTWVVTDIANKITSGIGQMHTRYNYNFAPLNFVRDALTNAWAIGADMGLKESAKFISEVAEKVSSRGVLGKAYKVAKMYDSKNVGLLENLAKTTKDPDIRNMAEFILKGGMTEYLEGMTIKSNFQQLEKELGRGMIMRSAGQLNKLVDGWTNMFEIASRSIAYGIAKQNYMKVGKMSDEAATIKAAEFAKNLANFEQVGEYGKGLGAAFMFFRPSATGAVRAIESLIPAFPGSLERAVRNLPKSISENPEALAAFKKNYAEKSTNARYMFTTLMAAGSLFYVMSYMMADDDEMGRNKTLVDDMNKWTRFARFHVPGFDKPFQMPWGFGWGAFAAAGAQLTAVGFGRQSFGDAMFAIGTNIALDSFVPIPVSRMDIRDNPALWALDSAMPSFARPVLEFVVNKNGLGQQIYSSSNRRMGDAYMGGDNIPETYKILAKALFNATNGDYDWSPNSIYFLSNSYVDGVGKIIDAMVSGAYLASGEKEFNPKTDLPFLGSFIGAKSNIDNKEFVLVEEKVKKMSEVLNTYKKANPAGYADYLDKNPLAEVIVATYDKSLPAINVMRAEAKRVRMMDISPKEKTELLKDLNFQQNIIKRNIVDTFEAYDVKP